jgi:hypothetical protein
MTNECWPGPRPNPMSLQKEKEKEKEEEKEKDATPAPRKWSGTLKVTNIPREAHPAEVEEAIAAAYHGCIPARPQRQDYVRRFQVLTIEFLRSY